MVIVDASTVSEESSSHNGVDSGHESGGDDGVQAMVDLIHKYVYTDRPREKAAPSIINGTMRLNEAAKLNVASVEDQLKWFQSEGLVDAAITLDTLLDTSYVETFRA